MSNGSNKAAESKSFVVVSPLKERLFVKVYHDFLDSDYLDGKEKIIFILLKRYLDFSQDSGGSSGEVYPSLATLSKQAGMTEKSVRTVIHSLAKKGVLSVKRQGLSKPNIYTIYDFPELWTAKDKDDVLTIIEKEIPLAAINELEARGYTVIPPKGVQIPTKKELPSDTRQSPDRSTSFSELDIVKTIDNSTVHKIESQERYTLEDIRELYDYHVLISDRKYSPSDIDSVMDILYDVLNTTKKTIKIAGEDKPAMAVIGKLMKLTFEEIGYAIEKYNSVTDRIKSPKAYMLTILYGAKEQMHLDISNLVRHDF